MKHLEKFNNLIKEDLAKFNPNTGKLTKDFFLNVWN